MRIAIYSRKSKWTGKGESIENQLIMCREYAISNLPDIKEEDITYYEDEGFSGKNTQRPQFQKMMKDIRKKHYDYLICYKLDRLGRNLSDFVNLIEELNRLDTSFISIKEKFDTSTPIGRAMMFFTGVLAQMEREQIAERVRDNMIMLARSGRWLGGAVPLGFHSVKEEHTLSNNKIRTAYHLTADEKELEIVRFIYQKFLEKQSLSWIVTYLLQNNIKTRNGKDYQISTIRDILINPVYCTADSEAYDYFEQLGCQVCIEEEELDGIHGLIGYGKTSSSKYKNKQNQPTEWIVASAKHKGVIRGREWVKTQQILMNNKKRGDSFRKVQNPISLLSGLLYCSCGDPMRPKNYTADRLEENGDRRFIYLCSLKEKTNRKNCNVSNVSGNLLDQQICNQIMTIAKSNTNITNELIKIRDDITTQQFYDSELAMLRKEREDKKEQIHKLIISLSKANENDTFTDYIHQQITQLDRECRTIEDRLEKTNQITRQNLREREHQIKLIEEQISSFQHIFTAFTVREKREYLRRIVDKIVWDGKEVHIFLTNM